MFSIIFVLFYKYIVYCLAINTSVEYYENLVTEGMKDSMNYILPTNASFYQAKNSNTQDYGVYDFVIVGAGSAGSVVANRLSEIEGWKILVLEAGDYGDDFVEIPAMYFYVQGSKYNWGFTSVPQTTVCLGMVDQKCPYPRGRGVGGSSLINGLMYVRGNKKDYDDWQAEGNPGWCYEEVLKYFIKSENANISNAEPGYHGQGGNFNVEYHYPYSPQLYAFVEANKERGRKVVDYNGHQQLGVSATQLNNIHGSRDDLGRAFLRPVLKRKNLEVLTESYATKILIDEKHSKKAYGVEFNYQKQRYYVRAKKEVIISCGAIQSPQLLQLSGIGLEMELKKFRIPLIQNLSVGDNLQDHATFYGLPVTMNYQEPIKSIKTYVEEYLNGIGPYSIAGNNQGLGFVQTNLTNIPNFPDIELMIVPSNGTSDFTQKAFRFTNETYQALWGHLDRTKFFKLYVILLHPKSRGTIRLKSSNPLEYPLIDNKFLSDPENIDIETIYAGVQLVLDLLETQSFKKFNATLHAPKLPACQQHQYLSKDYWLCAIRQVTMHTFHPMGTCKMGPNPKKGAVVDSNLKVHGVHGLRVIDASIFPKAISGHLNAPAVMVAEKGADLIKDEYL